MWFSRMSVSASPIVASGLIVMGSKIMPFSARLTSRTCLACASMLIFLWITPIPPSLAIAMARVDSVTVSIAAETIGAMRSIFLENFVERFTFRGSTSE